MLTHLGYHLAQILHAHSHDVICFVLIVSSGCMLTNGPWFKGSLSSVYKMTSCELIFNWCDTRLDWCFFLHFSPYKRGSSVTPSSSPLKKSGGSPGAAGCQKKGIRQDLRNAFGRPPPPGQDDEDETEESEEDDENQKSKKVAYCLPFIRFFISILKFFL